MNIYTRLFGEIAIDTAKVITFPEGIIGFPDMKQFMLIHDAEKPESNISWLQSLDDTNFAMPVINPLIIMEDYNPIVEDELFGKLGQLTEDNVFVLTTMTVPKDITKMTVNMAAPIVINIETLKAVQVVVDDDKYEVRYPIYDILKSRKEGRA